MAVKRRCKKSGGDKNSIKPESGMMLRRDESVGQSRSEGRKSFL